MEFHPSTSRTEASSSTNGSSEHRGDRPPSIKEMVFKAMKSGDWKDVLNAYKENSENIKTASITSSKEKVLHIAISHNRSDVAKKLLEFVADGKVIKGMKNDRNNNPLHLAASLGKADMCEAMMCIEPELIECRNMDGETPLFLAALHGRKEAFYTLRQKWNDVKKKEVSIRHCRRNDGNSILHVTILGEYFDLAFQMINWYPKLTTFRNERGQTPLHILALHPSVFRSGSHLGPLEDFIYRCLLVEELEDESRQSPRRITAEQSKKETAPSRMRIPCFPSSSILPGNYVTCFNALGILGKGLRAVFGPETWRFNCFKKEADIETPHSSKSEISVQEKNRPFPPNYYTCFSLLEFLLELLLVVCGLGFYKVTRLKEKKRRHVHSIQLMKKLVKAADSWEAEDNGSRPSEDSLSNLKDRTSVDGTSNAEAPTGLEEVAKDNEDEINGPKSTMRKSSTDPNHCGNGDQERKNGKKHVDQKEEKKSTNSDDQDTKEKSPFLVAAKMGVTEMVKEILDEFPVAIDDMNQEKKNAVLLAVENRQPSVYLYLQKTYREKESIFQKVDYIGNSALHLAATFGPNRPWRIPGAALQMQWELKWYKFVKDSMPSQFFTYFNDRRQTPKEILTETHTNLVDDASKWLTKTSESCSIVAALIATVAFASATTLPGGVKEEQGTPTFEGKAALDIFIISSLVALSFSTTSLTMFLSILTSRFQVSDFYCSLPSKLILGLSSLFASIASILVAFCSGHFLSIRDNLRYIFPIYAATCIPLTIFAVAQFPLYLDLFRSMMTPVPKRSYEMTSH